MELNKEKNVEILKELLKNEKYNICDALKKDLKIF